MRDAVQAVGAPEVDLHAGVLSDLAFVYGGGDTTAARQRISLRAYLWCVDVLRATGSHPTYNEVMEAIADGTI